MSLRGRVAGLPPTLRRAAAWALLGGALFAAERALAPGPPPAPDTRGAEAVLLDAAFARGWDRSDPVVQRRLVRNMRFLRPGDPRPDAALLEEAFALGLQRADLVVRRRLVQRMRMQAWSRADAEPPDDDALRALLAADPERWREPDRVRGVHVFLSRDRRAPSARLAADARALGERLVAEGVDPRSLPRAGLGDPFLLGAHLPWSDEAALAARFGPEFARAALAAPVGRWSGPAASSYGLHWIQVLERRPGRVPSFDALRPRLAEALRLARRRAAEARLVSSLRD